MTRWQVQPDSPILHIVKVTIDDLQNRGVRQGKIGVMATSGTLKTAMYQQAAPRFVFADPNNRNGG
jgi:aspartate/glutamate racemase